MTLTPELIFSIIGTVTGTLAFLMSWTQWRADRSLLRMKGQITFAQSVHFPENHLRLRLTMKNHGRRVIKIIRVELLTAENKKPNLKKLLKDGVPIQVSMRMRPAGFGPQEFHLDEGGRQDFELDPFHLAYLNEVRKSKKRELVVVAVDSLDREYRTSIPLPSEDSLKELELAMDHSGDSATDAGAA